MERLSTEDHALLSIEDDVSAVHGLTIGVFGGPQPSFDDLLDLVRSRIPFVPRFRQRLAPQPLPAPHRLIPDTIADLAFNPIESRRNMADALAAPYRSAYNTVRNLTRADETSFRATIGPHRRCPPNWIWWPMASEPQSPTSRPDYLTMPAASNNTSTSSTQ